MDPTNFDPDTMQRTDVSFDAGTGKPLIQTTLPAPLEIREYSSDGDYFRVEWDDGSVSKYATEWVDDALLRWKGEISKTDQRHVLWTGLTEDMVRSPSSSLNIPFERAIAAEGFAPSLRSLYEYGILLVTNTPIYDGGAGVAALASAFGGGSVKNKTSLLTNYWSGGHNEIMLPRGTDGPLRTLYGTIWTTTSSGQVKGASIADSAYGHEALPLHTDLTYHRDPPGLQIFTMVQPAQPGGESIFGDGFAVADRLRRTNPEAFATLAGTVRRYRCIDYATGWHLEGSGPVITVDNNRVVMIRHNDLDRLPSLPPLDVVNVADFYSKQQAAHLAWDKMLAEDETQLVIRLQAGDTIVVANQVSRVGTFFVSSVQLVAYTIHELRSDASTADAALMQALILPALLWGAT